jgi:diaminohydroxyphosphoribosylaminopyrimidine deaminase/5-amino-6-(5-phosphoribosylamino)uracil reductase
MKTADVEMMARALRAAERGLYTAHPNPRVGCVIVRDGEVVGEGYHAQTGGPHAEVVALDAAAGMARGATAYVTLEPCCHHGRTPPCTEALAAAGIARVVTGAADPNPRVDGGGVARLREAGIEVEEGVLRAACEALNAGFNSRMQRGRPLVRVKQAVSIDGRTALASGISQWISGAASRADVQRWRARSSAILTGVGTVLADDPSLNVRDTGLGVRTQPLRVVVDSRLRMPPTARLLGLAGRTLVVCAEPAADRQAALLAAGATVEAMPGQDGRVDLAALLRRLGELEMNELLVEAGPTLNGALLQAGLVDELLIYQAAHVLGSGARGLFNLPDLERMDQRPAFVLADVRRTGDDLRLTYRRK